MNSMIPWFGGKYYYANWIISHFPHFYEDLIYVEPFGGAGWVLFKKNKSRHEVYNDINGDLVNLFRVLRDNFNEFEKRAYWVLNSREMWKESYNKVFGTRDFKDDVDRALHFAICVVQSYNGNMHSWGCRVKGKRWGKSPWLAFYSRLKQIRERLIGVQIENLDYREILKKYDSENTLFYLDPPYLLEDTNNYYGTAWSLRDHRVLFENVVKLKGYWIISYYENEFLKRWYSDYSWYYTEGVKYSQNRETKDRVIECIITNIPEEIMLKNIVHPKQKTLIDLEVSK